jgi:hypothetical protein
MAGLSSTNYLTVIRSRSCYVALRLVIEVSYWALMAAAIGLGILMMYFIEDPRNAASWKWGPVVAMAADCGMVLLSILVLTAAKQSVLLLIDLTDATLAQGARGFTSH